MDGGPTEITYTVLGDSGGEESGVVTPVDMLSFARQVSMAMVSCSHEIHLLLDREVKLGGQSGFA